MNHYSRKRENKMNREIDGIIKRAVNQYDLFPISRVVSIVLEQIEEVNKKRDIEEYLPVPSISTIQKRILSISEAEKGAK
jgi:hypothetical protein